MKIKFEPEDFRVRELLAEGVLGERGEHRVYRVTKRKLTSLQAADVVASAAGANSGDVGMCGLKDRQGITTQYMSISRGKGVSIDDEDLRVETVGFSQNALASDASTGNAFELIVRGLSKAELAIVSQNLIAVRRSGLINYFDDQRFGNLRHNQGWIALDLLRGEHESALKSLLTAISEYEHPRSRTFKNKLAHAWGDWTDCRDTAGRFGQYHSVFEHLKKHPDDFAGAFFHVATRLRLIHLYAYQSHLWNRAVADFVRGHVPIEQRVVVDTREGPLVYPAGDATLPVGADATFRLPGPRLEDVTDERQRALLADALAADRLVPAKFAIEGVSGFQLKGEDRALFVEPRHLRVRPPERDPLNRPLSLVRVRFELPRGAYATLVVRRLLAERLGEPGQRAPSADARDAERGESRPWRAPRGESSDRARGERDRRPRREGDGPPRERRFERGPRPDSRGGDRARAPRPEWRGAEQRGEFRGGPPRADRRGPPRDDRRGPPRSDWRGPPRDERRGPPRDDRRGPPRSDWRGPPRDDRRGPPRDDRRGPPRADRRGPPRDDRRGPPSSDRRGPPRDRDRPGRGPRRGPPRRKQDG